jgi:hypothetical protein
MPRLHRRELVMRTAQGAKTWTLGRALVLAAVAIAVIMLALRPGVNPGSSSAGSKEVAAAAKAAAKAEASRDPNRLILVVAWRTPPKPTSSHWSASEVSTVSAPIVTVIHGLSLQDPRYGRGLNLYQDGVLTKGAINVWVYVEPVYDGHSAVTLRAVAIDLDMAVAVRYGTRAAAGAGHLRASCTMASG